MSTFLYSFCLAKVDAIGDFLNGNTYEPIREEEIQVMTLEDAKVNLSIIQNKYNELMNQINTIQQDLDAKVEEALPVQQEYFQGRQQVADLLRDQYKDSSSGEILNLILDSTSLKDFFQQLDYAGHIIAYRTSVLAEQQQRANAFQTKLDELNSERDQQCILLLDLQRKKDLAERILAEAKAKFGNVDLSFNQDIDNSSGSSISPFRPDPTPTPVPEPDPQPEPSEEGWRTGIASAYGGSSDPYTPNPGISCIGELVDDWSCGVAVPMAWGNYRSYLRRNVLIS
ncbi:MAG: recombination mediator protein UvsY, partial [Eggerthellaceae bacterium]|nr:recombination mediator protein UvsY [Eggerthellaceae bacterium]